MIYVKKVRDALAAKCKGLALEVTCMLGIAEVSKRLHARVADLESFL